MQKIHVETICSSPFILHNQADQILLALSYTSFGSTVYRPDEYHHNIVVSCNVENSSHHTTCADLKCKSKQISRPECAMFGSAAAAAKIWEVVANVCHGSICNGG